MFRPPTGLGAGNRTGVKASMKGNKCYHVEVCSSVFLRMFVRQGAGSARSQPTSACEGWRQQHIFR